MSAAPFNPCVVVPVYNHPAHLLPLAQALVGLRLPAWFIDDGSTAPTRTALAAVAAQPGMQVLRHEVNRGKGAACITGLRAAHAAGFTHAVQIDADGQHDATCIPQFLAAAAAAPTALILGQPQYDATVPRLRLYGRYVTHLWVWLETWSLALKDTLCGFRVYPLAATCHVLEHAWVGQRMDFDTSVAVQLYWAGVPVHNLPTPVTYAPGGVSHFRLWRDNVRLSAMHTRLVLQRAVQLLCPWRRAAPGADWVSLSERGSQLGLHLTLLTYRVLGRRVCRWLVYAVVTYFWLTGAAARRASRQYLERLYATPAGAAALGRPPTWRDTYRHFCEYGEALLDRLAAWRHDLGRQHVTFAGTDLLAAHQQRREGVILLGAHWGNLEVVRALAQQTLTQPIHVLMITRHAAKFNRALRQVNDQVDQQIIATDHVGAGTAIFLRERLAAGESLALHGDRVPPGSHERVWRLPFLGQEAAFPQGPFILAALLDCPVYLVSCQRRARDHYQVAVELLATTLAGPRPTREARLQACAREYVARLEQRCASAPFQWFNFYDFWA